MKKMSVATLIQMMKVRATSIQAVIWKWWNFRIWTVWQ